MKLANLLISCACLLLLQLEMGAARATVSGPSESLYATARRLGLDAAGLDEIWRTRKPLVIRKQNGPNQVTTVTYDLSSDGSTITKFWHSSGRTSFQDFQENLAQSYNPISEPESLLAFLNPFINPFGSGFVPSFFENWALPKGVFENSVTTTTSTYTTSTNGAPGQNYWGALFPGFQESHGFKPDNQRPPPPSYGNSNERNPNERNPNERNPNERNPNERNPNERNPNERNPNERNPNERNPNERNPNERNPNERNPNERNPNERNPNERNPNERNPNRPNIDDFNPNDPQWVPVPEPTTRRPFVPLPTRAPSNTGAADTVIDDFLAKVDVTTSDIKDEDGEYVRTIVDNNGRVLKAKFELVDTKSKGEQSSTQ